MRLRDPLTVTSAFGLHRCGQVDPPLPSTQPTPLPDKVPEPVDDAAAAGDDAAPANATAAGDDATAAGDDAAAAGDDATANNGNWYGSATVATVDPAPADAPAAPADAEAAPADPEAAPDVREGIALQWLNKVPSLELENLADMVQAGLPDGSLQNWVHSLQPADVQDLADDMCLLRLDSMS